MSTFRTDHHLIINKFCKKISLMYLKAVLHPVYPFFFSACYSLLVYVRVLINPFISCLLHPNFPDILSFGIRGSRGWWWEEVVVVMVVVVTCCLLLISKSICHSLSVTFIFQWYIYNVLEKRILYKHIKRD